MYGTGWSVARGSKRSEVCAGLSGVVCAIRPGGLRPSATSLIPPGALPALVILSDTVYY